MNWEVLEDYTGSDHQYIAFTLRRVQHSPIAEPSRTPGWNMSKLDVELLQDVIAIGKEAVMNSLGPTEEVVGATMRLIRNACDVSMPRRARRRGGKTVAVSYTHLDVYKRQQQHHVSTSTPLSSPRGVSLSWA